MKNKRAPTSRSYWHLDKYNFVLTGIFFLFSNVYAGDIKLLLASIVSFNSIAELTISGLLTIAIVPVLQKVQNKYQKIT